MSKDIKDRELLQSREVPFPRDLVWKVMTETEHTNQWWGPDGFRNVRVSMDFRVGGVWSYDMEGPDGTVYPNRVVFKEISPPWRMVFDHGDNERVWFEASVTLEETEKGTRVILRHLFPSMEERDEVVEKYGAVEGGRQHLANLEAYLEEFSKAAA
jgi:uncharacterized protein YndB with AHSA1/START domain